MPLVSATLASGLESMEPTNIEADAANALATIWDDYFQGAAVSGVPVGGSTAAAKSAMLGALTGMSATGAGPTAITAGITAYWGVIATAAPSLWVVPGFVTSPAVPPTTLAALTAALTGVFASNTSGMLPLAAAAQQIAAVLHASGGLGGIVPLVPIAPPPTPVPTPIL